MKRLFDLMVSLFALLVFAPLFLICAVAVKFTSKGPYWGQSSDYGLFDVFACFPLPEVGDL